MLIAGKAPEWFWRCGAWLFALQAHVFLAGIPYFQAGFWPSQEPRLLAVFIGALLACIWFWHGLFKRWVQIPSRPPVYFILIFAWIGWQVVVTFFAATSGWISWFGSAMYGDGAGYYFSVALFSVLAYVMWPMLRYRSIMVCSLVSALIIMALLQCMGKGSPWLVMIWPDYLPFLVGWTWMVLLLANPGMSINKQLGIAVVAAVIIVLSENQTAWLVYLAAAVFQLIVLRIQQSRNGKDLPVPQWLRGAVCALVIVPLTYTFYTTHATTDYDTSIEQRSQMNAIGVRAILGEPERLLMGNGWGVFRDDLFRYALLDGATTFKDGNFKTNTFGTFGTAVHSHNQPLEALLSLGIPGFLLWMALALYVVRSIPDAWFWRIIPIHMAGVFLSFFWFQLSFFCAFLALFWAAVARNQTHTDPSTIKASAHTKQTSAAFLFLPLAFVMLWSIWEQYRAISYADWLYTVLHQPYQEYRMEALLEDAPRGGDRFYGIVAGYLDDIQKSELPQEVLKSRFPNEDFSVTLPDDSHRWVERLLNASYLVGLDPHVGVHIGSLDINIQFFLQTRKDTERYAKAQTDSFLFYPASVVRLAKRAPLRDDLATPYLYHLDKENDTATLSLMLARLRDAYPEHRTVKWLSGKLLHRNPQTADIGLQLMREALNAGVDNIYPITLKERRAILGEE